MNDIEYASDKLGISKQALRIAIQRGAFKEFAQCWKSNKHYSYYINRKLLAKYLEGGVNETH